MTEWNDITILEKLGKGVNGVVYKAESDSIGYVAVKTLRLLCNPEQYNLLPDEIIFKREETNFIQQINTLMKLSHPNLVRCFGVWFQQNENRKIPHIVNELGECGFDKYLSANKLSKLQAINFGLQIAKAIKYLHENSIAHLDIKPANMVLFRQGEEYIVKLIDFGKSKFGSNSLTTQKSTPAYLDPKVAAGHGDYSADIYSFGCVLIEMVCGYEELCRWKFSQKSSQVLLPAELLDKLGDF